MRDKINTSLEITKSPSKIIYKNKLNNNKQQAQNIIKSDNKEPINRSMIYSCDEIDSN